ncbi:unnamed protein product [Orchesella dallaii]|uniref:Protein sleepless n=1 Tax=Orchesella dallaii TaxID=48710 RepID=A0ABP1QMJ4_9HEXA
MHRMLVICVTVILVLVTIASGKISTRCYACRSRGEQGDCKDPFTNNATSIKELAGNPISVTSCPSGWCRKQMEGVRGPGDDYGAATERACLPLSPPDGEERCAEVNIRNKITLLCVCRGDLCNSAQSLQSYHYFIAVGLAMSILTYARNIIPV